MKPSVCLPKVSSLSSSCSSQLLKLGFSMAQAMDVGGEVMESTIPSLIVDYVQKGEVLSPEDSAWVDSCLISESDNLDDDWSSLKGALLEILNSQPESLSSSALPSGYRDDDLGVTGKLELGANVVSQYLRWSLQLRIFSGFGIWMFQRRNDLVKQLEKALEESSLQPLPPTFDDSDVWKNLKVDSVDALIAGIADLSLGQISR
ncbi:uncharacterized protein Pyn_35008 [Prunus yedoensis var. nudiflora]|uniref:Uncharacterized protein n=1 Tax=Prunus yedoensis var. nudiflora TaxID=2094558 RepID=A0A314UPP9_PRUYE|nr:uncharacterized protein Pyn_35008 [Prunus yedoensis var. nudiflora]